MTIPDDRSARGVPIGYRVVEISREPIELYKVLKFEGMSESGGHARAAVGSGQVLVNGTIETQKRKKIRSGDTIEYNGDKIHISFCAPTTASVAPAKAFVEPAAGKKTVSKKTTPLSTKRVKK